MPKGFERLVQPWKGDLDGMTERRVIRVLTVQNPVLYFVDKGREVGITYEAVKAFEKELNQKLGNKTVMLYVVLLPVPRDELLPRLLKGEGDLAAAQLTITPERRKLVDFSDPFATGITEVLVTGPQGPAVANLDELSGKEVYVRLSSSYAEHLKLLNARFAKEGKAPVKVTAAPGGPRGRRHPRDGERGPGAGHGRGQLHGRPLPPGLPEPQEARRHREPSGRDRLGFPQAEPEAGRGCKRVREDAPAGLARRQRPDRKVPEDHEVGEERQKRRGPEALPLDDPALQEVRREYSLDYLLMAAQGYQESGLDQSRRSHVGAIGVMQVMPATARDKAVNIPDIEKLEGNIHAGIKYNRWVVDNFFQDPAISKLDKGLFAFASYNAGPSRVAASGRRPAIHLPCWPRTVRHC